MMKILCTLDGSPESEAILPVLRKLAREAQIHVSCLTVIEEEVGWSGIAPGAPVAFGASIQELVIASRQDSDSTSWQQVVDQQRSAKLQYLADVTRPLESDGAEVELRTTVAQDPGQAIISAVHNLELDFVAMATHGRSGIRDVLQGSVAQAVMKAGVPMLLVRPGAAS